MDIFAVTTRNSEKCLHFGQLSLPGSFDHDLIFMSFDMTVSSIAAESRMYRDFKRCNTDALNHDANLCPWHLINESVDVDEQLRIIGSIVGTLFDKHISLRKFKSRPDFIPYYNSEIEELILERNIAYGRWKEVGGLDIRADYVRLRNRVTLLVRQAKKSYYARKLDPGQSSKIFWDMVEMIKNAIPR